MTQRDIEEAIDVAVRKIHGDPVRPIIIGAIPDIPDGLLVKYHNEHKSWFTLMIPMFERYMASLANCISLPQLPVKLPNLDLTNSELFKRQTERYIDETFNAIVERCMDGNPKDSMEGDESCSNGDHKW